jgi:hypothetical protein|tara:strand:+ start:4441 stop:5634 length:1194 start_codon:yes stop_codon:yes gene_type:complete
MDVKKGGISFLFVLGIFLTIGFINASVDFITPANGTTVSGSVFVSWENGTFATSNLMQKSGACNASDITGTIITSTIVSSGNNTLNVSGFSDGFLCLKIADGITLHENISIKVDNANPTVTFLDTPYFVIKNNNISIAANLTDGNLIKNFTIDFGDSGTFVNSSVNQQSLVANVSHNYTSSGQFTVRITATDTAGNVFSDTEIVTVNSAAPDWVISLKANETNLFSIPLTPNSTAINDVIVDSVSDNAEKIWSFQQGEWIFNTPITTGWSTSSSRELQTIVPGFGYIIFMNNDSVVTGTGKSLGQDTPPEVTLTTGWNLIGHYGVNATLNSSDSFSSLQLGNEFFWDSLLNLKADGSLESVTMTNVTRGYWLSIKGVNLATETELRFFRYLPAQVAF